MGVSDLIRPAPITFHSFSATPVASLVHLLIGKAMYTYHDLYNQSMLADPRAPLSLVYNSGLNAAVVGATALDRT